MSQSPRSPVTPSPHHPTSLNLSETDGELTQTLQDMEGQLTQHLARLQAQLAQTGQAQLLRSEEMEERLTERLYWLQKRLAAVEAKIEALGVEAEGPVFPRYLILTSIALCAAILYLLFVRFPGSPPPEVSEQPARVPQPASLNSGKCRGDRELPTRITLINQSDRPVSLHWINENCQEIRVRTLGPGEQLTQQTYATQSWRVRDRLTGQLIKQLTPTTATPLSVTLSS